MNRCKRYRQAQELIEKDKRYTLPEAVGIIKNFPKAKFDETVEIAVKLGVDPRKSDQLVRGTVSLPNGTGKTVRVLVFAKGEALKDAKEAGADYVGLEDLVEKIQGGWTEFDVAIASPETMRDVGKLGKVLGPRGLMPSPKAGTVTPDVAKAVKEVKKGKIEFKVDKTGNVHVPVGKSSFDEKALIENASMVFGAIVRLKPAAAKGQYLQGCNISTTMGPGVKIDVKSIA